MSAKGKASTNWTMSFYSDPAFKKKISDTLKKSRAARSEKERELHNARIAVKYRIGNAHRLFNNPIKRREWVKIAEDRLAKATAAIK
jgi:hypothetical protein